MRILFPEPYQRPPMPLSNDGRRFYCPCFGGTEFTVYTHANIPQASCPVCGSVCEPRERVIMGTTRKASLR